MSSKGKEIKKRIRDNPPSNYIPLLTFSQFKEREAIYKRRSGVTHCQLDLLAVMVNRFILEGSGCTINHLASKLNSESTGELRNVRYKLQRLIASGYVELLESGWNYRLYIPTQQALDEMASLCK